jgi:protein-tyrosine phosphatase
MERQNISGPTGNVLKGASNFRSLGGLCATDGRYIRPYALMRAERLSNLTAEDWEFLASVGLATVCDLRGGVERERHPNRMPAHVTARVLTLNMSNDMRGDPAFLNRLARQPDGIGAEGLMLEIYQRLPEQAVRPLRTLFSALLADAAPVLIHCTAGKDRTGFVVAVILAALQIPITMIYQDYLLSSSWPGAAHHRPSLSRWLEPVVAPEMMPSVLDALLQVRRAYLDAALAAVDREFGTMSRYLGECGLDIWSLEQLRMRLLTLEVV